MQLQFSLEDDNDVDIKIDADSINIEINNIEDEIGVIDAHLNNLFEVSANLRTVRNHIKKFGITKEFLHLVNENNKLGSAIGLVLPYYENDNANLDQIDQDELPDVDIVVEAIDEKNKSFFTTIKSTFKKMTESFSNLYNKLKDSFASLESQVKTELAILKNKKELLTEDQLKLINVKFITVSQFREIWASLVAGLNTCFHINIAIDVKIDGKRKAYDLAIPRKAINQTLAYFGKELINEGPRIIYSDITSKITFEEKDLLTLHWNEEEVIKFLEKGFPTKAGMEKLLKNINAFLSEQIKKLEEFYLDHHIDYASEEDYHNAVFTLKTIMRAYTDMFKETISYIKHIISISRKLH